MGPLRPNRRRGREVLGDVIHNRDLRDNANIVTGDVRWTRYLRIIGDIDACRVVVAANWLRGVIPVG